MKKILLVEDDVGIARFISQGLRARGREVHWERVGKDVVDLACTGEFNTVILDLLLPDRDGLDICADIRAADVGVPVLMLTARGGLDDRLDGFAAGADDYLRKPFAFDELIARVEVLVRRDRLRRPDPVRMGKLRVDLEDRAAEWDGVPIELGRRAFALLTALAKAGGKVVSREALIDEIWGPDSDITENSLDVCVSTLRRKLETVSPQIEIETVRGQGIALRVNEPN